jgi:molecular chaperone DnaJ
MTPQEAYKILDVSQDISDDDLKKKWKNLAKDYHPDLYKEDPNKFKQINEAYQLVKDYRANPNKYQPNMQGGFWNTVVDLGDIFFNNGGDFFNNGGDDEDRLPPPKHIKITVEISFQESVLGCTKEVAYDRNLKCTLCQGSGGKKLGNGCDQCDGFGRKTINNKGMIFQTSCAKCFGKYKNR